MPMTAQQQADAYKFFIVAFGAAPGTVYMDQLSTAYDAGLTTKQIVNIYTTKEAFTARYPNFLSNGDFATSLVNNVVGNSANAAAKTEAVADITAALNSGFTRGDIIFQVFHNLSTKDPAVGQLHRHRRSARLPERCDARRRHRSARQRCCPGSGQCG